MFHQYHVWWPAYNEPRPLNMQGSYILKFSYEQAFNDRELILIVAFLE